MCVRHGCGESFDDHMIYFPQPFTSLVAELDTPTYHSLSLHQEDTSIRVVRVAVTGRIISARNRTRACRAINTTASQVDAIPEIPEIPEITQLYDTNREGTNGRDGGRMR